MPETIFKEKHVCTKMIEKSDRRAYHRITEHQKIHLLQKIL